MYADGFEHIKETAHKHPFVEKHLESCSDEDLLAAKVLDAKIDCRKKVSAAGRFHLTCKVPELVGKPLITASPMWKRRPYPVPRFP